MSAPLIRCFIYLIFYIAHYLLSILVAYASWTHLLHGSSGSWYLTYIAISIFGAAAVFAICVIFYCNRACGDYWSKGAIVKRDDGSMRIDVYPGRPVMVLPGQYINLWCPSLNPWSWFQGSSFIHCHFLVSRRTSYTAAFCQVSKLILWVYMAIALAYSDKLLSKFDIYKRPTWS